MQLQSQDVQVLLLAVRAKTKVAGIDKPLPPLLDVFESQRPPDIVLAVGVRSHEGLKVVVPAYRVGVDTQPGAGRQLVIGVSSFSVQ